MKTKRSNQQNIFRTAIAAGLLVGLCSCSSNKLSNIGCGYGYQDLEPTEEIQYCYPEIRYTVITEN